MTTRSKDRKRIPLEEYKRKRDFSVTPEPSGAPHPDEGRAYVVQKHAARRLHYDFRLELDGVLLSWAVPKGPDLDPSEKHLAVRTEDHPVEYGSFEGVIPEGEYGGGTVMLWDRGTWEPVGDPHEGLRKGDLKFRLHGEKLQGQWVLVHMKGRSREEGKENWLLIKHRDEHAVSGDGQSILKERDRSVASGRSIREIAEDADSLWHSDEPAEAQSEVRPAEESRIELGELPGAKRGKVPRFVEPQLALLVKEAPAGDAWLHEIKLDGYRAVSRLKDGDVTMWSRRDKDWTGHFRTVADELGLLPASEAMLDGEVCVIRPDGVTSFQALQNDLGSGRKDRLVYFVFDLLFLDGYDLRNVPLRERKRVLRRLLSRLDPAGRVRYSEHIDGHGPEFHAQGCEIGLEGVISKLAEGRYLTGRRTKEWVKTKCVSRQEFVIGGWTDPSGGRTGFGSLLLGLTERGEGLRYAGKVGTGFNERQLRDLGGRLREMTVKESPFTGNTESVPKKAHFVRPQLVGEVEFTEWTDDGQVRHPSFRGMREDKMPADVVAERPAETPAAKDAGQRPAAEGPRGAEKTEGGKTGNGRKGRGGVEILGVGLSNPDRVFYPEDGLTKRDLAEYYEWVGDAMIPYVQDRPIAMVRCPQGIEPGQGEVHEGQGGECFFHKHAKEDFPGPYRRLTIQESSGPAAYLAPVEPASLVAMAQMGVLEIHIWGSHADTVDKPDYLVFDLDPDSPADWPSVVEGARLVRGVLDGLGLVSFVKTTGGKGLHVVVPIAPREDWDTAKRFTEAVAKGIAKHRPDDYVATMSKAKRKGKVFVDYLRNARSNTSIAPYSTRARPHATVSVPIRWDELSTDTRSDAYTIKNLKRRLSQLKSDPWEGFFDVEQTLTPKMRREIGVS